MFIPIKPAPGINLIVEGTYKPGEPEVGIPESFDVIRVMTKDEDITNIIEWATAVCEQGGALSVIAELCLENVH